MAAMSVPLWMIVFLAIVQGLTEFFPVSSSGHLVMLESLLRMRGAGAGLGIVFEVGVHLGTLGAVIIFYRRKVRLLCEAIAAAAFGGKSARAKHRGELSYIGLVIVGSIPAGILGAAFNDQVEAVFDAPSLSAAFLVVTGLYLLSSRRRVADWGLTWRTALIIGCAQAIAILPGCSRSGWTITTGLLLGVGFAEAAQFSFMLSIPAVLGATLLEIVGEPLAASRISLVPLAVGIVTAFLSGLFALKLLIGFLDRGIFHRFAWYLIPAGILAIIWFRFFFAGS